MEDTSAGRLKITRSDGARIQGAASMDCRMRLREGLALAMSADPLRMFEV